tara:strand:+ start:2017 stop:2763 length:747 start_codon:yes stop_codon:yes gene_type:complete
MNYNEALKALPETEKNVLAVLSGGMDSSIMTMLLIERYGKDKVLALSYDYGQKQREELNRAAHLCTLLDIPHNILDLNILGEIAKPISANIGGTDVVMPTIQDVLGDPQPKTYVPFRNLILLSLTMAQAEASDASHVFTGLQVHDQYGYWDTSQRFVDSINAVAEQNRTHSVKIEAPFAHLSKYEELMLCQEMDKLHLLASTLTCYNPDEDGKSCGVCPSCAERVAAFMQTYMIDPIEYSIDIPWNTN